MEITGKVKMNGNVEQVTEKFQKRALVVETQEQYPQNILIEFQQERVSLLDNCNVGDLVKVWIDLRGREYVDKEGQTKYFNTIVGWKLEIGHLVSVAPSTASAPAVNNVVNNVTKTAPIPVLNVVKEPELEENDLPF